MAYSKHPIGALIQAGQWDRARLREARVQILAAYRKTDTQAQAAAALGCDVSSLIRWVSRLDLKDEIAQIRGKKGRHLSDRDKESIRRALARGVPQEALARQYGRTQARISQIGRE